MLINRKSTQPKMSALHLFFCAACPAAGAVRPNESYASPGLTPLLFLTLHDSNCNSHIQYHKVTPSHTFSLFAGFIRFVHFAYNPCVIFVHYPVLISSIQLDIMKPERDNPPSPRKEKHYDEPVPLHRLQF